MIFGLDLFASTSFAYVDLIPQVSGIDTWYEVAAASSSWAEQAEETDSWTEIPGDIGYIERI